MIYIFETRYVKKYGVGRGGGADQKKIEVKKKKKPKIGEKKKPKIRASSLDFLVMHPKYCDRLIKTVYIDQGGSTFFPGKYNI